MSSNKYFQSLIGIRKNQLVTSSLKVARVFGKAHRSVMRKIKNLVAQNGATNNRWYYRTYRYYRGQCFPYYLMTKDGFSLLVMGFTGKTATQFKIGFINAFNDMEHQLMSKTPVEPSYMISNPIRRAKRWIQEEKHTRHLAQMDRDHQKLERVFRSSKTNVPIGQVAKVISNTGHFIGRNNFFKWMRHNHYLISRGRQYNVPYQKWIDMGLFKVTERVIPDSNYILATTVLVTPKGQQYLVKKYLGSVNK